MKMTPREALYHIILELGPVPQSNRGDNLTPKEIRLRDAVRTLQDLIHEQDSSRRPDATPSHLQFGPDGNDA